MATCRAPIKVSDQTVCTLYMYANGVARMLKSCTHQRGTTGSSSASLQLNPFSKWELLLKEIIRSLSQREQFFPLRAVPCSPLNVIFLLRTGMGVEIVNFILAQGQVKFYTCQGTSKWQ